MNKFCAVLSAVLIILILIPALVFAVPLLIGCRELTVLSGSMEPSIPVGAIVCVDTKVTADEISSGDVVTYSAGGIFVTHRVQSVDSTAKTFVTKGDANASADGSIAFSELYGRVIFHIPYFGYVNTFLRTPPGIITITGVTVIIILLNTLPALLKKSGGSGKPNGNERC